MNIRSVRLNMIHFWLDNCRPDLVHARALQVNIATSVTKVFAAAALHMVTPLSFFDPKFAEGTHLVFGAFHKLLKGLFIFVRVF